MAEESLGKQLTKELRGVVTAVNNQAKEIGAKVGDKVNHVLGPEIGELTDWTKTITTGIWDVMKQMGAPIARVDWRLGSQVKAIKAQTDVLDEMNEREDRREKRELGEMGLEESIWDKIKKFLLIGTFVLSGVIGAFAKKILLPFEVLAKISTELYKILIPITKTLGKLWDAIKKNKYVVKLIDWFQKTRVFRRLERFVRHLRILGWRLKKWLQWLQGLPFVDKILKAFKFGFKVVGKWLAAFFLIFDFLKGWLETEGDWKEKLSAGLTEAWKGFMDLPLDILNWFLEQFGIEKGKTTINESVEKMIDSLVKGIGGFIEENIEIAKKEGFGAMLANMFKRFITLIFKDSIDTFYDNFGGVIDFFGGKSKEEIYKDFGFDTDSLEGKQKEKEKSDAERLKIAEKQLEVQEKTLTLWEKLQQTMGSKPNQYLLQNQNRINNENSGNGGKIAPEGSEDVSIDVAAGGHMLF